MALPNVHPDDVLGALLSRPCRPARVRNLKLVHAICKAERDGGRDFSTGNIARHCEAAGGLGAAAFYNAASRDYRLLIAAWKDFVFRVDGPSRKPAAFVPVDHLHCIPDPALRVLMRQVIIERDRFRTELNMLKSVTKMHIDRRPGSEMVTAVLIGSNAHLAPAGQVEMLEGDGRPAVHLDEEQRAALAAAIDDEFLEDQNLKKNDRGEIVNTYGRVIYSKYYLSAIKKALGQQFEG